LKLFDESFGGTSLSFPCKWESRYDDLVKSLKTVTPAEAGVQNYLNLLDSRFRGNDKIGEITTFYETLRYRFYKKSGFLLEFSPVKTGAGMTRREDSVIKDL
jgi:hypothetical protein